MPRGSQRAYFDLTLAHGTTTTASFCTIHPESVEAYFAEAHARNLRAFGGKTCMDRNAPEGLRDTAQRPMTTARR
jgi:guanine deaminase